MAGDAPETCALLLGVARRATWTQETTRPDAWGSQSSPRGCPESSPDGVRRSEQNPGDSQHQGTKSLEGTPETSPLVLGLAHRSKGMKRNRYQAPRPTCSAQPYLIDQLTSLNPLQAIMPRFAILKSAENRSDLN